MKNFAFLVLTVLTFSVSAKAAEIRVTGAAAEEIYNKLNIVETLVVDEHGGSATAVAKYGKFVGCQKSNDGLFECWILQN